MARPGRYPVIVIDEVGYIPFEAEAANLFFQFISSRYERASVIVTSNKPFGRSVGVQEAFDDSRGQRLGPEPVDGGPGVSVWVRLVVRLKEGHRVKAVGHAVGHVNPASRNCGRAPRDEPLGVHDVTTASRVGEVQRRCPEPNVLIDQPAPLRSAECDQLIEHSQGSGHLVLMGIDHLASGLGEAGF